MSPIKNYTFTEVDLHRIINNWGKAKEYSEKVLNLVISFNLELQQQQCSISQNSIARQAGFQHANR